MSTYLKDSDGRTRLFFIMYPGDVPYEFKQVPTYGVRIMENDEVPEECCPARHVGPLVFEGEITEKEHLGQLVEWWQGSLVKPTAEHLKEWGLVR